MKAYSPSDHRNVALIGHGGAGKTTLAEALLHRVKATPRLGSVTDGSSVLDYLPEEHKRQASVGLAAATFEHAGHKMTLIDTPGFPDFSAEVSAALHAAEAAMLVVSADAGMEVGSELTWRKRHARQPSVVVINGMDREQADGPAALKSVKDFIGPRAVALEIPMGSGDGFVGLCDVLHDVAVTFDDKGGKGSKGPVPDEYKETVAEARAALMENAAESSEELMNKYFEAGELTQEELVEGIHKGVAQGDLFPVLFCSATTGHGIGRLLNDIAELLPGPGEHHLAHGVNPDTEEEETREPKDDAPVSAFVFKTTTEAHVGELFYVKVMSGTLKAGDELMNTTRNKTEKISQLFHVVGKERKEAAQLSAGDIGVAVKLRSSATNDTLSDKGKPIRLDAIQFPKPVIDFAIRPTTSGDEDKMGTGLHRLAAEDASFHTHYDDETHETIVSGLGETHIELAIARLKERYGVEVELAAPRIPYRETIRGATEVSYRHKKQTGGRGQFAEVHIRFEPNTGNGYEFDDKIVGGAIPGRFIPAVDKGLQESLGRGPVAGYQMVDLKATLFDGKFHDVDSSEAAFKMAASQALKQGAQEAQPTILEPYFHVRIVVPKDYMGDVMGDLSSRRGKILGMEAEGDDQIINAHVPASELQRYSVDLRSLTQGRASFERSFSHYEDLNRELQAKVIAEAQVQQEELAKK